MSISVDISGLKIDKICKKFDNDTLWLFAAKEWKRLYSQYVPHNTGQLRDNVTYKPKTITHISPYSKFIYYGMKMVDPVYRVGGFTSDGINFWSRPGVKKKKTNSELVLKNGYRLWDKKAIQEGKDKDLAVAIGNWTKQIIEE